MRYLASTMLLALAVSACSDRGGRAAGDSSDLARDLALANQTPVQPQLQDTAIGAASSPPGPAPTRQPTRSPARTTSRTPTTTPTPTPAPARDTPAPQPPRRTEPAPVEEAPAPAPAPRFKGFQAGTSFGLVTKSSVCTTNLAGDKIVASLTEAVHGEDGALLPAGTSVVLEVASVTPGDTPEHAEIALRVRSIDLNDQAVRTDGSVVIESPLERRQVPRDKNSDRRKVVAGAVAGAVLGQIMGKDTKSTVIGAAAGAAAGTAVAVAGTKYDACLPAGATVRIITSQPISIGD